jgi:hypothetical protein
VGSLAGIGVFIFLFVEGCSTCLFSLSVTPTSFVGKWFLFTTLGV